MTKDQYPTLSSPTTGEFRDRGSKFFAYAFPAESTEEALEKLEEVRAEHHKARHHCYAFRIGIDGHQFRANDDGEPSGTAGRPILGQIDRLELRDVIVVVVRYFGGTKLGTSGLINAYKTAAAEALDQGKIILRTVSEKVHFTFDYALMSSVMTALKQSGGTIKKQEFTDKGFVILAIPKSEVEDTLFRIKCQLHGINYETPEEVPEVEGLTIERPEQDGD